MTAHTSFSETLLPVVLTESIRTINHKYSLLDEQPVILKAIVNSKPGRVIITHGNEWGGIKGYSTIKRVISHQHNTVVICCYAGVVCRDSPEFIPYMDNPYRIAPCIPRYTKDKHIIVTEIENY